MVGTLLDIVRRGGMMRIAVRGRDNVVIIVIWKS